MASSYINHSLNPRIRSYSKSQMYLFKILHIISSIPPSNQQQSSPNNSNNKGVGIDLNLTFSSITDTEESESSSTKTVTNTSNNNNNERQEESKVVDVDVDIDVNDDVASELENEHDTKTSSFHGDSNCIDLLIEAARVLSEKNEPESESDSEEDKRIETELPSHEERVEKKKERWVVVDLYETEPVVRSKRGRNQTLPCRFRDSVVEPLKRKSRNQRVSSTTNAKKRLLR